MIYCIKMDNYAYYGKNVVHNNKKNSVDLHEINKEFCDFL